MRRVAHLLASSSGGIRQHVAYLAAHPPAGYETAGVVGPEALSDFFPDVTFLSTTSAGLSQWESLQPDVLHAHGLTAAVAALRGAAFVKPSQGRPATIVTVHTSSRQTLRSSLPGAQLTAVQRVLWLLGRSIIHRADAVVAVSEEVAAQVGADHVIPPAIQLPRPRPDARRAIREELGTPDDRVVAIAVARLHPDKALDMFIGALEETEAEGWIVGEGPERARLEAMAAGTGVRLLGQRDDVGSLLAAADLFALPAVAESYGLAVLEAVSAGLPVVATKTGSIPDFVGEAGILVDPKDDRAFTAAVRRLVDSGDVRRELALKAAARALPTPGESISSLGRVYDRAYEHRKERSMGRR